MAKNLINEGLTTIKPDHQAAVAKALQGAKTKLFAEVGKYTTNERLGITLRNGIEQRLAELGQFLATNFS